MRFCLLLAALFLSQGIYAQQNTVRMSVISKADSVIERKQTGIDSAQQKIVQLTQLTSASDTSKSLRKLRQEKFVLQQKVDSLTRIGQPTALLQQKLDSLNTLKPLKTLDSLNQQLAQLQQKIQDPLNKVEGAVNKQVQNINTFTANQVPLDVKTSSPELPATSIPNDLPTVNTSLPKVNTGIEDIKTDLQLPKEVQQAKEQLGKVGELSSTVDAYQNDIQQIKEGGLGQSTELGALAEKKIGSIDEVSALQGELGKTSLPVEGLDEEAAKAMLKEQAQQEVTKLAKDHFAGKEAALTAAMTKLSDFKMKYESLDSLNVPKRRANPMKGKKLSERLVSALSFQVQRSQNWLIDVNPSLAYLITKRLSAGLGWNQRFGFGGGDYQNQEMLYGPRVFSEFRWNKGISFRLEGESLYGIPVSSFATPKNLEDNTRWITSAFVGVKKDYRIINRLRGTLFVLYLIYDDDMSSPYSTKLTTRFGFEYKLTK